MRTTLLRTATLLAGFLWLAFAAAAQERSVQGTVFDADGKTPLVGVTVIVRSAPTRGTVSGADGKYSIRAKEGEELTFTYLGYEQTTQRIGGGKTHLDVTMQPKAEAIEGIVVTALGMTREQKALGYAVSKVDNQDLTAAVSNNWLDALSGKVAGLNFDHASSGPGGSLRVTLRGESTVNMDNNTALFVIDGVPMSSGMTAMGGAAYNNTDAGVDYGNGAADLNPEDIDNVSVLKGPAATALYGSRAANGAIVITTKAGRSTKGLGITFSSNFSFERAGYWPDFQDEYGPGNNGAHTYSFYTVKAEQSTTGQAASRTYSRYTWGPRYEGQKLYQWASYDPQTGMYTPLDFRPRDWYKGFFETGATYKNSVSISGNNGRGGSIRVSFTDVRNTWIVPNTGYKTQSFSVSFAQKLRFVELAGKVNYYRKDSDNLPMIGYSTSSPTYTLLWSRNNLDIRWYEQEYRQTFTGDPATRIVYPYALNNLSDNPYSQAYEQLNTMDRDRVYGNVSATFDIYKGLKLMLRTGLDMNREFRTRRKPFGTLSNLNGYYRQQNVENTEMNNDFLLTYERPLGKFHVNASFGGNSMYQQARVVTSTAEDLLTEGVYNLSNAKSGVITKSQHTRKMVNSLYGLVQLSYDDCLFLDITGRNDWSSTLPSSNNSYFYPSVSASVLLNELIDFGTARDIVNLVKLRGSFAQVGNDTKPYRTSNYLTASDFAGNFQIPRTAADLNLKPEIVSSWEVGADIRLFRSRLNLDVAYYDSESKNQIVSMPVSQASGVASRYSNTGRIRNWGWEVSVNGTLVKTKKVQWKAYANWALNRNRVLELGDGVDSWIVASYSSHAYMTAYEGQSLSTMYGLGYKRAPEGSFIVGKDGSLTDVSGQLVIDENGYPQYSDDLQRIGECMPDWKGGFGTSVKWNGLTLSVAFDGQFGGHVYSYSNALLGSRGKGTISLPGRYDGLVLDGVNLLPDGNYVKNTHKTADITEYYGLAYAFQNAEQNFVSTQFLKLRELRLDYEFPKKLLARTGFIKGLVLSVYGRDLFCWSEFPGWDPEGAFMRGSSVVPGFEIAQMPGTRAIGGSIKITF